MDYSKTNPWRVQKLNCSLRTSEKCRKTIWKSSYQPLDFNFHWLNKVSAVRAAYISKICKNSCDYGCVYFLLLWSIYLSSLIKDVQDKKDWHLYLSHCVIRSQLLQICFPNTYFLYILITCDEQTFYYSDKVWFILKDASQISSAFRVRMPQILMFKPRPVNLYIKVNSHLHQDLQNHFSFQDI